VFFDEAPDPAPGDFDSVHVEVRDFYDSLESEQAGCLAGELLIGELNQLNDEFEDGFGVELDRVVENLVNLGVFDILEEKVGLFELVRVDEFGGVEVVNVVEFGEKGEDVEPGLAQLVARQLRDIQHSLNAHDLFLGH